MVAMNGTKFTFRGLENIPERGGALLAQNHTSYLDWLPPLFAVRERGRRMYFMITRCKRSTRTRRARSGCRGGWGARHRPEMIPRRSGWPNCKSALRSTEPTA
jgi:hypothetical protein